MAVPYSADVYQAVLPGGQVTLYVSFETYLGSGQPQSVSGVTVAITAAPAPSGGTGTPVPTTSAGITQDSVGVYAYPWACAADVTPGNYTVTWTAASPAITITQAVEVSAPPSPVPLPGVYATAAQYQAWSGDSWTPSWLLTRALRRASEVIDNAAIGAVYQTDADSMPTDAGVISVFMRATCAQAEFMIANGDFANVKSQYASTSMGGVSQSRAAGAQMQIMPPLAPQAAVILHTAGLLPGAPLISWLWPELLRSLQPAGATSGR